MFRNYYRLKCAVSVSWNLCFNRIIAISNDSLCCVAVAAVAGIISGIVIFLVAQMLVHFGIQSYR